ARATLPNRCGVRYSSTTLTPFDRAARRPGLTLQKPENPLIVCLIVQTSENKANLYPGGSLSHTNSNCWKIKHLLRRQRSASIWRLACTQAGTALIGSGFRFPLFAWRPAGAGVDTGVGQKTERCDERASAFPATRGGSGGVGRSAPGFRRRAGRRH